jgi:hypothetical protein
MKERGMFPTTSRLFLAFMVVGAASAGTTNLFALEAAEENEMDLSMLVPEHSGGWRSTGQDSLYDRETIFRYMNGAGEVYLSFTFQRLLVRSFAELGGKRITVELYDMGSAADAYGIFSRNRQGEDVHIGQGSEWRSGYLIFWKERFFVTVFADEEGERAEQAVLELGAAIAGRIEEEGALPAVVSLLPQQDLMKRSIRYFHKHTDLNQHYFIADDNILNLDMGTDAVIAEYRKRQAHVYLLIIHYPNMDRAASAFESYIGVFMPEARDSGVTRLEDGSWAAAIRESRYIVTVLDAPTRATAEQLMTAASGPLGGGKE